VGSTAGIDNEAASSMMQKFWDTAMATSPVAEDDETRRLLAVLLLHYRVSNLLLIILTGNW
jgi:hypothetical protein